MTGNILPKCPEPNCVLWTPHTHGDTLVAPVYTATETTNNER